MFFYIFLVYHMKEDGWIKVCKEDVSDLIHKYRKGMFWVHMSFDTHTNPVSVFSNENKDGFQTKH